MLLPAVATVVLLAKWRWRPKLADLAIRLGFVIAALMFGFTLIATPLPRHFPNPGPAMWMGIYCAPIVLVFLRPAILAVGSAAVFLGICTQCIPMYKSIVRRSDMWANQLPVAPVGSSRNKFRSIVSFTQGYYEGQTRPASYVADLGKEIKLDIAALERYDPLRDFRLVRFWHSSMSNIAAFESRHARVWFDGGTIDEDEGAFRLIGEGEFRRGLWPPRSNPPPLSEAELANLEEVIFHPSQGTSRSPTPSSSLKAR
jgi:hypothetical protein